MLIKLDSQNPAHQKFSHELQIERYGYKSTNIPFLTPNIVPTLEQHLKYLQSGKLSNYCIFMEEFTYKGVIYLKDGKDICIFIAKKHLGDHCGERCLTEFLGLIKKNTNITQLIAISNVNNAASNSLFVRTGFTHAANLYGINT